jgi:hypothetical protein
MIVDVRTFTHAVFAMYITIYTADQLLLAHAVLA